jgi:hypothetical protein
MDKGDKVFALDLLSRRKKEAKAKSAISRPDLAVYPMMRKNMTPEK